MNNSPSDIDTILDRRFEEWMASPESSCETYDEWLKQEFRANGRNPDAK